MSNLLACPWPFYFGHQGPFRYLRMGGSGRYIMGTIRESGSMAENINILYSKAKDGDATAEDELFRYLSDRIRYSVHRKVGNKQDAEELAQEALVAVLGEYRDIEITTSFAAWVFKIVDNRILNYRGTKKRTRGRHIPLEESGDLPAYTHPNPDLKRMLLECLKQLGDLKVPTCTSNRTQHSGLFV